MTEPAGGPDFFISFAAENRSWAEWITVELDRAGYSTLMQTFDFRPGTDFVQLMQRAVTTAGRTIAVLSPAYFASAFGAAEWGAVFARDPTGELRLLLPVRVQPGTPPGLLTTRVYVDLVGVTDEAVARRKLLAAADGHRPRPTRAAFPNAPVRRYPGSGPAIGNLPDGSSAFSGRAAAMEQLYAAAVALWERNLASLTKDDDGTDA